jgi:hypothetical protein
MAIQDDANCALDQPCKFGHRVESHAVYCHHDEWEDSPRKCRRSWATGGDVRDEDCPGFRPNPEFKGEVGVPLAVAPLCSACGGTRLRKSDRKGVATCGRCMGDGVEPQTLPLSQFGQDTLELGLSFTGRHPASHEPHVRVAETREQYAEVCELDRLKLISIRSVSSTPGDGYAFLIRLTPKGDAVMRANWAAAKVARGDGRSG